MAYCINCGKKLVEGAKFCAECGKAVNDNNSTNQRKTVYDGEIHKCPNCGNTIDLSAVTCELCGFRLNGKEAIFSAKDFQQQLLEIERTRQNKKLAWGEHPDQLDATDKQIIALIKAYPIPNTIEDIVEFMHLAVSNIDIKKSNKSAWNTIFGTVFTDGMRERAISDAWVGKLQSVYSKAELYFPTEPEFIYVKANYEKMMQALKIK